VVASLIHVDGSPSKTDLIPIILDAFVSASTHTPPSSVIGYVTDAFLQYCTCLLQSEDPAPSCIPLQELYAACCGAAGPSDIAALEFSELLDPFGAWLGLLSRAPRCDIEGTPLRFSQRGLNTVVIALYCVLHGDSLWDTMFRLITIGGDVDTVGAVAMTIAGALYGLPATEAVFTTTVALAKVEVMTHPHTACALHNARSLAERYRRRATLFVAQEFDALRAVPDLLVPDGLDAPTWRLDKGRLRFEVASVGRFHRLSPDHPTSLAVGAQSWSSVHEFAMDFALTHPHTPGNVADDSYAAGLRDGLALALARSLALVTDLLATYDAELIPVFLPGAFEDECFRPTAPQWGHLLTAARTALQAEREHWFRSGSMDDPLSNLYPVPNLQIGGQRWPSVEHYVQAQKFEDPAMRERIRTETNGNRALELGRSRDYPLRADWSRVKLRVTLHALVLKFQSSDTLGGVLKATAPRRLVAIGDDYWGVSAGRGTNFLGRLLMKVREGLFHGMAPEDAVLASLWDEHDPDTG